MDPIHLVGLMLVLMITSSIIWVVADAHQNFEMKVICSIGNFFYGAGLFGMVPLAILQWLLVKINGW